LRRWRRLHDGHWAEKDAAVDMAKVCVGLALGQVAIEGFGQIQPQHQDFRGDLRGIRAEHQTKNTPNNIDSSRCKPSKFSEKIVIV
jgi:hypothetical protein